MEYRYTFLCVDACRYSLHLSQIFVVASIAEALRDAPSYGFNLKEMPSFDWGLLKSKRDAYVKRLNGIYERNLGNDSVEHLQGWASFVGPNTVHIQQSETESVEVEAKNILIATGKHYS